MGRKVRLKPHQDHPACPKCGNKTDFICHSNQYTEDCCELHATCICGYEPDPKDRLEDVWGGCDDDNCIWMIRHWQDGVQEKAFMESDGLTDPVDDDQFTNKK